MAKSIMGSKFSATLDDARRRKVLADLAAQSQGMAAAPMSSGAGRMALERASAPAMQPATRGMIGAQAPMGQARRAEAQPAPEAAPQMRTRRFQEMGMPQAQPQQRSIFGRPVEGIARAFGYDPISEMSPLAYMMSGNIGPERIKENRLTQAEERKIAQYDQFIDQLNLSPQEAARARIAMRSNPEKFGENLAAGFGTNVLPSGSILNRGFGAPSEMNPKGEDVMGSIPQGYRLSDDGTQIKKMPGDFDPMAMTPFQIASLQQRERELAAEQAQRQQKANEPPALPAADARAAAKAFTAVKPFKSALERYSQAIQEAGPDAILGIGEGAAKLRSAHRSLAMQLKGTAGLDLGALVGPDFRILNDMIGDPEDPLAFYAQGGKQGAQEKLDQIALLIDDKVTAFKEQYAPYAALPELARFYEPALKPLAPGAGVLRPEFTGSSAQTSGFYPTQTGQAPLVPPSVRTSGSAGVMDYDDWAREKGLK